MRSPAVLRHPQCRERDEWIEYRWLLLSFTLECFVASQIGCYQGFAFAWRCLLHGCATEKDR